MTVTIRNLAEKLNLSITTVSRALDGYHDVAEETRQRVIEAAHEMGYVPSYAARQLRRKRSDAIGYILPTSSPRFSDPFYVSFLTGLCDEVASRQLDLSVTSCPPDSDIEQTLYRRWVQSRRVDGVVLNRVRLHDWRIQFLAQSHVPFVALGKSDIPVDFPYIEVDDQSAVQDLVAHLVGAGHRQIAFIGASPELVIHANRFNGYQSGLEAAGIPYDSNLYIEGDLSEASGYQAAAVLLNRQPRPTAILGINDLTALGVVQAAKERGIDIGTDLAIAGYDGIKETEYTNPPLTTVYQPTYEIARNLAQMLIRLIEGDTLEESHISIKAQLMIRPSTG
ncbi:MAG TPA: LacI family DNA-binding transcriptional regulator [Pseudomonadales bacterium]|nr:LacI family DNA-binding transcriptional regulator [Pseudomonadales bacterium]